MCGGVTTFSTTGTMGVVNIPFVCVTEETIRRLWDVTRGLQVINCFNCYGNWWKISNKFLSNDIDSLKKIAKYLVLLRHLF
jgi:hypothetical protein